MQVKDWPICDYWTIQIRLAVDAEVAPVARGVVDGIPVDPEHSSVGAVASSAEDHPQTPSFKCDQQFSSPLLGISSLSAN